ncbi:MAG: hypothetical protein KatS3mg057_3165 [Herpetosiphonaceae bacterium]|nr:MAG: hypothetical protein KatS3mg057_3165 [Herpetosiphonaceae bacterium]
MAAASHLAVLRRMLRAVVPFLLTALAGALLALLLMPRQPDVVVQVVTATPAPSPTATIMLEPPTLPPPSPTPLPLPEDILSQRLRENELAIEQLTSSIYILKAAAQIQSGRLALRDNRLEEVNRELAAAWASLDLAAATASEVKRDAIKNFQQKISYLQDDLPVRPEGLDGRMADLWQSLMALLNNQP